MWRPPAPPPTSISEECRSPALAVPPRRRCPEHGPCENVILRRWQTPALRASPGPRRPTRARRRSSGTTGGSPTGSSTAGSTSWRARCGARGVGPDAPIATVLGNRPEWVEVALASARLGARLVPASWRSTTDELDYLVRDSGAVLVVTEPAARAEALGPTLHVGDEYERALAEHSDAPIEGATTPDFVAIRVYTSGTTGRPKAIVRPSTRGGLDARRSSQHVPARLLGPHRCRRGEPDVPAAAPWRVTRIRAASACVRTDRRDHGAIRRRSTARPHRGRARDVHEHGAHAVRPHRGARPRSARPLRRRVDEARPPRIGAVSHSREAGHVRPLRPDHLGDVRRNGGARDDRGAG